MPMLADVVDAVVGVDTHRDTHSACMVTAVGIEVAAVTVSADQVGYEQLVEWALVHAPGTRLVWAVEGTRSHGAG